MAILLIAGGSAFADSIGPAGNSNGLIADADASQLHLPVPQNQYYFFQMLEWNEQGGPDLSNFGQNMPPGAFMTSGNTMYHYNDNLQLAMYVQNAPLAAQPLADIDAVPEPAGLCLAACGVALSACLKRRRSR